MAIQTISSGKKFNNNVDYMQRKKNTFSKKNNRAGMTAEKSLRSFNKQKDLKKINKERKAKQERSMAYSRVYIRNGTQMYNKFDDFDDYNRQFMDRKELFEIRYYYEIELDPYYNGGY